ncbi:hypothetical protein [Bauldia litoralis]|uniref:Phage tail repeat like n=1 Tax=Bauldia litoralis TaxID=665467 RepID=A0A1G6EJ11_9HYPH|nr:hypothetical protein [Bauldia litoralis]SDB57453.1 hypothetical protein SAMN02982931_04562 [Bauldia litoralis]
MANVIRIKRRVSGAAGAPAALKSAELAHNEVDDTLYVGKGDDGGGNATSVVPLAGKGAFVDRSSAQTVGGKKTFSSVPAAGEDASADAELIRKSQFDAGLATKSAASHGHAIAEITSLQTALDAKAPLVSPALTGTPTAPTAAGGANSTQIATTAFVAAAVGALIDAAPGALDTLAELAAALGDDPDFAATVTNGLAGKLAITSNLADLGNVAAARDNLGLGSMATQAADNVAITGGSVVGLMLDGGTF